MTDAKKPPIVDLFYKLRLANVENHLDSIDALVRDGVQGAQGPQGSQGPPGDVPRHQWRGSELRFELPDGWGPYTDLRGPGGGSGSIGNPGVQGPQGFQGANGSGSGTTNAAAMAYAWFMS
jgi:hypothetical protein